MEGEIGIVGISDYAVSHLSDLVFLDLPDIGTDLMANEPFGEIESVKAVSDLFCPVTGEAIEHNENLLGNLDMLKEDPFGEAWMMRVKMIKLSELEDLLTLEQYEESIKEQEAENC